MAASSYNSLTDFITDPFDTELIIKGCWKTCLSPDSSQGVDGYMSRVDSALFPMYRDPSTLSSFLSSAKQFSCAQICEDDFKAQRINIILLLALFGLGLISALVSCLVCSRGCCPAGGRDVSGNKSTASGRGINRLVNSSVSSLNLSNATTISIVEEIGKGASASSWTSSDQDRGNVLDKVVNNHDNSGPISIKDMNGESMKSIASVNKWIDNSNKEVKSRKKKPSAGTHRSLTETSRRLARRLMSLEGEEGEKGTSKFTKQTPVKSTGRKPRGMGGVLKGSSTRRRLSEALVGSTSSAYPLDGKKASAKRYSLTAM